MEIQENVFNRDSPYYEHFELNFTHNDILVNETTGEEYTFVHEQPYRFHVRSIGG